MPHRFLLGRDAQLPPYEAKLAGRRVALHGELRRPRPHARPRHASRPPGKLRRVRDRRRDRLKERVRPGAAGLGQGRPRRPSREPLRPLHRCRARPRRRDPGPPAGRDPSRRRRGPQRQSVHRTAAANWAARREVRSALVAYRSPVTSWLNVQPDLQYVIHPNTDPRAANALVSLIRVELSF